MYPTWPPEELCAMLGQRVRGPLSLLYPSPVGTASDRAASFLLSRLQQRKQERWEDPVISIDFSHSSRKARRNINKLIGRSGRSSACAQSRQIPSPRNWWRTGHTRLVTASQPGSSSNSSPTFGGFQHMRVTVSRTLQAGRVCCSPQTPEPRKISWIGLHLPGVHTPRRVGSQIFVLQLPQFLHALNENSEDLEKSTGSCDP